MLLPGDTKGSENMLCEVISVGRLNTSLFVTEWLLYCDMEPEEDQKKRRDDLKKKNFNKQSLLPVIFLKDDIRYNAMYFGVKQNIQQKVIQGKTWFDQLQIIEP